MYATALANSCTAATFANTSLFGAEILNIKAGLTTNFSGLGDEKYRYVQPTRQLVNATFCNVTVSYTHPGQGDQIGVEIWLPVTNWNSRFEAVGGGGWVAGRWFYAYANMIGALADGYATSTTDAGLLPIGSVLSEPWALNSPGNVNLYNLNNLASISLNDQAIISKSVIKNFYGNEPEFSYWNGCSQGGRQGLMLAQRYPDAYDGIAAGAPAINWAKNVPNLLWPQQVMSERQGFPLGCEIDAITAAAVTSCDNLDGLDDGIIGEPLQCLINFDPFSLVGSATYCNETGRNVSVSEIAAVVVNATWHGMSTNKGKSLWYGLLPGSNLAGTYLNPGVAATNCSSGACVGIPQNLVLEWIQLFVAKDPSFKFGNLTREQFDHLVHLGVDMYDSIIGTNDPDLSSFRDAGGKVVIFHGLADDVIPPQSSMEYYNNVKAKMSTVDDFYRYYEVPGLSHCFGGSAGQPTILFDQLRAWVENGTAPESSTYTITDKTGTVNNRIICPYPEKAEFNASCGDPATAVCFNCV